MRPPKYVRAIHFKNSTSSKVNVICTFNSQVFENYELAANETLKVEREENQGSYTTVDHITRFSVKSNELVEEMIMDPDGVRIYDVEITQGNNTFNFALKNHE